MKTIFIVLLCCFAAAQNTSDSFDMQFSLGHSIFLNNTININLIYNETTDEIQQDFQNRADFYINNICYFFNNPSGCKINEKPSVLDLNGKIFFRFTFEGACTFTMKNCTFV